MTLATRLLQSVSSWPTAVVETVRRAMPSELLEMGARRGVIHRRGREAHCGPVEVWDG
jgi:hypothetical protein